MPAPRRSVFALLAVMCLLPGCASSAPRANDGYSAPIIQTTRLTSVDLQRMTDQMSASLIAAEVLGPDSVVVTDRVVNRTSHIIDADQKRLFLIDLRAHLINNPDLRALGVTFVETPDAHPMLPEGTPTVETAPNLTLTATFLSLTNQNRGGREDTYSCVYHLIDLQTGAVLWEDAYPVRYSIQRGEFE